MFSKPSILFFLSMALLQVPPVFAQNVGIGVVTPLEKLHVAGNVRVNPLAGVGTRLVGADANGTLAIIAAGTNGQLLTQTAAGPAFQANPNWALTGNAGTSVATNFLGTTDGVDFAIRTSNVERVRVLAGGFVGIGTAVPTDKLHVDGDIRVGLVYPTNSGVLPSFGNRLHFAGGASGPTFNSDNSDPLWMARYNAGSDLTELRVNLSDNCDVNDAFVIQTGGAGCAANTVFFRFDGTGAAYKPGGGAWAALSDRRLKHNVRDFADGLSIIKAIRPVSFQYNGLANTSDNGAEYVGVIAQELQQIAPYMVKDIGEYLSVDPSALTYVLINAVKEQQAEIEALKAKDNAQQMQLASFRQELDAIKATLGQEAKAGK